MHYHLPSKILGGYISPGMYALALGVRQAVSGGQQRGRGFFALHLILRGNLCLKTKGRE